jgi:hypothetical protein
MATLPFLLTPNAHYALPPFERLQSSHRHLRPASAPGPAVEQHIPNLHRTCGQADCRPVVVCVPCSGQEVELGPRWQPPPQTVRRSHRKFRVTEQLGSSFRSRQIKIVFGRICTAPMCLPLPPPTHPARAARASGTAAAATEALALTSACRWHAAASLGSVFALFRGVGFRWPYLHARFRNSGFPKAPIKLNSNAQRPTRACQIAFYCKRLQLLLELKSIFQMCNHAAAAAAAQHVRRRLMQRNREQPPRSATQRIMERQGAAAVTVASPVQAQ